MIKVTWSRWPPSPYIVKTLKKSSPERIDWWPWNLICSIVYTSPSKLVQIITLGWSWPIYAKVKFGYIGFCMGKSENYVLFGNYCSHRPQTFFKYSNKWVYEVKWVSKVKVIIWPWPKVTEISKLKRVSLGNNWVIWNQISYESLWENGNENLYKWVGSHDQGGCHAHIW